MTQILASRPRVSGPADRSLLLGAGALDQYFDRIARHNLLTPGEEVELAQAIEMGNEARIQLGSAGRKTRAVKRELLGAIRRSDQARETMRPPTSGWSSPWPGVTEPPRAWTFRTSFRRAISA